MDNIIIYGAGGLGREVHVLIKQINRTLPKYNIIGFADDDPTVLGKEINGLKVIGNKDFLKNYPESVVIAIALLGAKKEEIVKELIKNSNLKFDNLQHPDIYFDDTNEIGRGNILCHGMLITCNVQIGDFNVFNGKVGIGHDVQIGNYNLLGPNSFIAGEVKIGNGNTFAMNSSVLQQKSIGSGNTVNMNSVIIRNIGNDGVYFGIPAIKQTF